MTLFHYFNLQQLGRQEIKGYKTDLTNFLQDKIDPTAAQYLQRTYSLICCYKQVILGCFIFRSNLQAVIFLSRELERRMCIYLEN